METKPAKEHAWLQRLIGEWEYESEAVGMPGPPTENFTGTERVRALGPLWIVADGEGAQPGSSDLMLSQVTFGYDPQKGCFVGTWIGSVMAYQWVYEGRLDASERVLTLDCEGPSFTVEGAMSRYRDIIEIIDDDHRVLRAETLGEDGQWQQFMETRYRRVS
jgi:hypothetical protein